MTNAYDTIRQHLDTLANKTSKEILAAVHKDHDRFLDLTQETEITTCPSSEIQFYFVEIKNNLQLMDKQALSMDAIQQRISFIEARSGVKKIIELEYQLKHESNFRQAGIINRELSYLKSKHAKELSELVSNRQQRFVKRLTLIDIWRNIISLQLKILDHGQKRLMETIFAVAEAQHDAHLLELIDNKLKDYKMEAHEIQDWKKKSSTFHSANIKVLKQTLVNNLSQFARIEDSVTQKQAAFKALTEIANTIRKELPQDQKTNAAAELKSLLDTKPAEASNEKKLPQRMVYQQKK